MSEARRLAEWVVQVLETVTINTRSGVHVTVKIGCCTEAVMRALPWGQSPASLGGRPLVGREKVTAAANNTPTFNSCATLYFF